MITTTFEGENFTRSKRTGLFVPEEYRFELDHPYLTKALQATAPLAAGALAGVLFFAPAIGKADTPADHPAKPSHSLFTGSLVNGKDTTTTIDNILDYHHKSGAQLTVESIEKPLTEPQGHILNFGGRSPFLLDCVRLTGILDSDVLFNTWGYTGMLEVITLPEFIVRAGAMQDSRGLVGGFGGVKFTHKYVTLDADVWGTPDSFGTQGFIAGVIPIRDKDIYLAFGGDLVKEQINLVAGLINSQGFGFFSRNRVDLTKEQQYGRTIFASNFTFRRANFDFRSHIFNNTEMRGVTTGYVLDSWPPLDGKATDGIAGHFAASIDWFNNSATAGASGIAYWRALPGLMFGLGMGDSYLKETGVHNPTTSLEIYGIIPKTPLDAWVQLQYNLRNGTVNPQGYIGVTTSF